MIPTFECTLTMSMVNDACPRCGGSGRVGRLKDRTPCPACAVWYQQAMTALQACIDTMVLLGIVAEEVEDAS